MIQNVGNILLQLREEMGISQTQLGRGLADAVEMSRLENGILETDGFLLEALFQRLGKSVDKLELTISESEYKLIVLRAMIFEGVGDRDYELVQVFLEEYEAHPDSDKPLHRQYIMWMQALFHYLTQEDKEACARRLADALEVTFPGWREGIPADCCLCMQEVRILLFVCALRMEMGETRDARKQLMELFDYLEKWCTDAEEKAKIYPQCAWILGKVCCMEGDWGMAYDVCGRGVECLAENGVLTVMDKLLEVQSVCLDQMGREEERSGVENVRGAIAFLYQVAGIKAPDGEILYLLLTREQKELLVNRELLRELRLSKGLSQEKLSEGICSWETLSRIEGGKRKPNRKNLYQMFQKMGMDRERYYGYIQADNFSLYEKVHEVHARWMWGNSQEATILVDEIAERLDMDIPVNRQFVETHRMMSAVREGRITREEAIGEAERILRYTMKDYQGIVYRTPFRQECVLLNQIALHLKHSGQMGEALQLWKQILDRFQASQVVEQHHASSLMLVYTNYAGSLEVNGCLDQSEEMGMKGIRLALKCQRGDNVAKILANLACVFEKRSTQAEDLLCEKCLYHSFYLLRLYGYVKNSGIIKRHYEEKYGKELQ